MRRLKLLVIEDNSAEAELALDALAGIADGVAVEALPSGEAMLEHLASERAASLVLLDLNLPGLSGAEVLKRLKANEQTASIPVIVLSSSDDEEDVRRAYALGASCYLVKPIDHRCFVRQVEAITNFWLNTARLPG